MSKKNISLHWILIALTCLFIFAQVLFFYIHINLLGFTTSLENSAVAKQLFLPVVVLPVLEFVLVQLVTYALLIGWVLFAANSISERFHFSDSGRYSFGIVLLLSSYLFILTLNHAKYPNSFFSTWIDKVPGGAVLATSLLIITSLFLLMVFFLAVVIAARRNSYRKSGLFYLLVIVFVLALAGVNRYQQRILFVTSSPEKPDVILIGLDSLRPDFTGFYGHTTLTPNIDAFLRQSIVYERAYTPLARTFPSWVSILTSKYPRHNGARANLVNPANLALNETLAKRMQSLGYETIFMTDEARFSDINNSFGFDHVERPKRGAAEFFVIELSDFPIVNLLVNSPVGRFLLPYHYANRPAHLTYEPSKFVNVIERSLSERDARKPLFLAVHLCVAHWPYASAALMQGRSQPEKYRQSVEQLDQQFGELINRLNQSGLLQHSIVMVFSDHGTTVGLPGDRSISKKNYQGKVSEIKKLSIYKYSSAPEFSVDFKHDYGIDTAYGQGGEVLSEKQYQVVFGYRRYGEKMRAKKETSLISLLDVAPTVLDALHVSPLTHSDGQSLLRPIKNNRPIFIETGDRMDAIETSHIRLGQVLKEAINAYEIDPVTGSLWLTNDALKSVIANKQRAVLQGDWLFAEMPASKRNALSMMFVKGKSNVLAPYDVLLNVKTGAWTMDMASPFAKRAHADRLRQALKNFYGNELISQLPNQAAPL